MRIKYSLMNKLKLCNQFQSKFKAYRCYFNFAISLILLQFSLEISGVGFRAKLTQFNTKRIQ